MGSKATRPNKADRPEMEEHSSFERMLLEAMHGAESLKVPALRARRRQISKRVKDMPGAAVIRACENALGPRTETRRFLCYEVIYHHPDASSLIDKEKLRQLGDGIDSWAAVDMFGYYLSGPAWREGRIADAVIHDWARSSDRWWRRAALVSTVPLNSKSHGGHGDSKRTLAVCRLLLDDRDDMVVKAMSWALRKLSEREPRAVQDFVESNRGRLAARVIREVDNKLRTGKKNPRTKDY